MCRATCSYLALLEESDDGAVQSDLVFKIALRLDIEAEVSYEREPHPMAKRAIPFEEVVEIG
jgi:hypothetical protein